VCSVSSQVLTTLEYVHSAGFTHNDIKAANLLFGTETNSTDIYLVDFGLCVKYIKGGGHKEYKADPRKAHDGTIEYLSRDAHIGCTSRRSDLECLAFNIVHWLQGTLPWVKVTDPKKVQAAKESYVKDLSSNIKTLPKNIQEFIKYSVGLEFDEAPDYDKCRSMFASELKKSGKPNFGDITNSPTIKKGKASTDSPKPKTVRGKAPVVESQSEEEIESSPVPVKKARKASKQSIDEEETPVKKTKRTKKPVVESQSDEEIEESPVPAKRGRKPLAKAIDDEKSTPSRASARGKRAVAESRSTQVVSQSEEEDMFASSPSPKKRLKAQEIGVQTSPAFVAAAKAAKVGKKALDQSEYRHNGEGAKLTPSVLRRKGRSSPAAKKNGRSGVENGETSSVSDISNPTPAMLAILNKKKQVEAEKNAKKRKKM